MHYRVLTSFSAYIFYGFLFLICWAGQGYAQQSNVTYEVVKNTADLQQYKGISSAIWVTDTLNGGLFFRMEGHLAADFGVIYPSVSKSSYWQRQYERSTGVDVAWFLHADEKENAAAVALKRALRYPLVKLNCLLELPGKTKLNEGTVLEIGPKGGIATSDTLPVYINCSLKAPEYQQVFYGNGRVLFSTTSVPYVSPCWFGAVADCPNASPGHGTDNTQAIRKAISAAENVSEVFLPPTSANLSYRITGTLNIVKKLHFFAFRFHGGGTTVTHSASDRATTIFADFKEGAAINVQGSRRVYLNDFCLLGKNELPKRLGSYNDSLDISNKVIIPGNFLSEGLLPTYTGITTDGEKELKVWSADVVFDNLLIEHFYLGIGISQAGNLQGDRMRVQNSQINFCVYGISLANHQNRACHYLNVDMNRVWCGVTNCTFADHTGAMFQITGGQWCNMYKCFDIQPSYQGQCVINGLYTEAIGSIGIIGDGHPNNSSVLFTGCHFMIRDEYLKIGYAFKPPFYTLLAAANVTFTGCNFWAGRDLLAMCAVSSNDHFNGASISLNGCSVHHCKGLHIHGNNTVNNTFLIPFSDSVNYNRSITVDFGRNHRRNTGYYAESAISGEEHIAGKTGLVNSTAAISRKIPRFYDVLDAKGDIDIVSARKDTIIFKYSHDDACAFFRSVYTGDVLGTFLSTQRSTGYDNPTLKVITHDTVLHTLTCIRNTADIDFEKIALYTNTFFTIGAVTGLLQQGADRVRQVTNVALLQKGDFITFDGATSAYRVADKSLADSTIVLSRAVTEPVSGRHSFFNEQLVPNEANATLVNTHQVTGDYMATAADRLLLADESGRNITITLPLNINVGQQFVLKRKAGLGKVIIAVQGGGAIDGKPTYELLTPYQGVTLVFDGKEYLVVN